MSTETPDQGGQGGQRRQYHQIRSLAELGHDITVLVPESVQADASIRRIVAVERPRIVAFRRLSRRRFASLQARIASPEWDAVIVAHVESCWLLPSDAATLAPVLVDVHNVLSRWFAAQGRPDRAAEEREREAGALRLATAVCTCSAEELRRLVAEHPAAADRAFAAPLGIDPAEWPDVPFTRDEPVVAMFGSWDWDPNAQGLAWFAAEVWPRVRELAPDAVGLVAGSGAPALPDGMRFVGRVSDLATFGASATVVAVPVLNGVGAAVKFAESLATGAAVIATPDGANAFDRAPAFVSDDPAAWAEWIAARLDGRRREPAPDPARDHALHELTWSAAVRPIDAWLRVLRRPSGGEQVRAAR